MQQVNCLKLKAIQDLFSLLVWASSELNSLFSIPALFLVTSRLVIFCCSLFKVIEHVIGTENGNVSDNFPNWISYLAYSIVEVAIIMAIFITADSPVKEVFQSGVIFSDVSVTFRFVYFQVGCMRVKIITNYEKLVQNDSDRIQVALIVTCSETVVYQLNWTNLERFHWLTVHIFDEAQHYWGSDAIYSWRYAPCRNSSHPKCKYYFETSLRIFFGCVKLPLLICHRSFQMIDSIR